MRVAGVWNRRGDELNVIVTLYNSTVIYFLILLCNLKYPIIQSFKLCGYEKHDFCWLMFLLWSHRLTTTSTGPTELIPIIQAVMSFSFTHRAFSRLITQSQWSQEEYNLICAKVMREPALLDLHITPEPLCQKSTSSDKGHNCKAAYGKESYWATPHSAWKCNELFLMAVKDPGPSQREWLLHHACLSFMTWAGPETQNSCGGSCFLWQRGERDRHELNSDSFLLLNIVVFHDFMRSHLIKKKKLSPAVL